MCITGLQTYGFGRREFWILCTFLAVLASSTASALASPFDRWNALSEREKTFLRTVFSGDEPKATEYIQVAGINPNNIAGEPLSVWFYRMGNASGGRERTFYRDLNVQRIIFERLRQNPNPSVSETNLENFCNYAPYPTNVHIEVQGTPEQRRTLQEQQDNARKPHIEAMAAGFQSLLRYGLKDRKLIQSIFIGCMLGNAPPRTMFYYDTVLAPMIRAGASVNGTSASGMRPVQQAVEWLNPDLTERLVRDGATVNFPIKVCGTNSNLYGYIIPNMRMKDQSALLRLVTILSQHGLPPTTVTAFATMNGYGQCTSKTLYGAAVDAGDLDLARRIKEAGTPTSTFAAGNAQPVRPAPSDVAPPTALPTNLPAEFGGWKVALENSRLTATATAGKSPKNGFAGLKLECVAGRLEYAPIALKIGTMTSLWLSDAGDAKELKLANQRAAGAAAVMLSKELAALEAGYQRQGNQDWSVEFTVESAYHEGDAVRMTGFSKMRAFMLANCKS